MKVLVILGMLFAYSQATSEPVTIQEQASLAIGKCVKEIEDIDAAAATKMVTTEILPEGDDDFTEFFACYWKKLGLMNDEGVVDEVQLKFMVPYTIKSKYPDISNADQVAADAVDHCKDTTADSLGLKAIKYRNCMTNYVKGQQE